MQPQPEQTNAPEPAQTTDVALSAQAAPEQVNVVQAPPEVGEPAGATEPAKATPVIAKKTVPKKRVSSSGSSPVLGIVLASIVFLVLSGLAYYAYTKNG